MPLLFMSVVGVRRAQRVAEHVRVDLAEVVGDLAANSGDAVLARVELAVRLGDVGEDLRLDRRGRQRERLERDDDLAVATPSGS